MPLQQAHYFHGGVEMFVRSSTKKRQRCERAKFSASKDVDASKDQEISSLLVSGKKKIRSYKGPKIRNLLVVVSSCP